MAAATSTGTASLGYAFSIRSKAWPCADPMFLTMTSTVTMLQSSSSISHSLVAIEPILMTQKWRMMRVSAAVDQEEAAVTATVEEEQEEQVSSDGDGDVTISTKLYFGNLPYHCDSAQLAGIIQEYASPELVEVLYDKVTGKSRGFAFVTMTSIEDCNSVIEKLDGCEYGGRLLRVNFSGKPRPKEPLYPETEYKLFVGNLSWSVTSESLAEAFREYGSVVGARVLYDGESGRSRGYGFVSYTTKSDMETALQALNGVELEGREMRVSLAQGKKQ